MTTLTRKRGDSFADEMEVISRTTQAPMDITGYSFVLTVDPSSNPTSNTDNLFALTGLITDPVAGLVEFAPSTAQSDVVGSFYYDIQMTDDVGKVRTIQTGRYVFEQDISK